MPIYAYRCNQCGSREEHLQKMSDPPMTTCESCGGGLERMITPTAFHLKGGGWYKDLYSSSKPASDSGGSSGSSSSGSSSSSSSGGDTGSSSSGSSSKAAAE